MLDQNFLFMAFLMLCFAGLATMFYFMMRNIDDLTRMLREDRNQMQTNLRALESSLNHLADLLSRLTATEHLPRGAAPLHPESPRTPVSPAPMSGPSPLPGLARNPDNGPSDPMELRSAMLSPLHMADETPASGFGSRASGARVAEAAYGDLSFDPMGDLNVNLESRPMAAANGAPGAGRPASGLSLSGVASPQAASARVSSAAQQAPAAGVSALPNLSLDGGVRSRRR